MAEKRATATEPSVARNPRLLVLLGRQRTGKTLFAQWYAETTASILPLNVVDADQGEQVLSDRLDHAVTSPRTDDARRTWLESAVEKQMSAASDGEPYDLLLDLGGSDPQVKHWGAQLNMVEMIESAGVDVIAIHMVGPDVADLSYMKDIETNRWFCPAKTIVIFNRALIGAGQDPVAGFAPVIQSDPVKKILMRGGRVLYQKDSELKFAGKPSYGKDTPLVMEPLRDMPLIELRKLKLMDVVNGKAQVQPFAVARTRHWLNGPMAALRSELGDWIG
jgi:hypothetical protein